MNFRHRIAATAVTLFLLLTFAAAPIAAPQQTAGPGNKFAFTVSGPPDLAAANAMIVRAYVTPLNGAELAPINLTGLTCVAGAGAAVDCTTNLPSLPPGQYTAVLTAAFASAPAAESPRSPSVAYAYIAFSISNVRIV